MPIIYKITSPTNRVYIGQTWNINKRKREYKNLDCKSQKFLYRSLVKYGFNKHTFEIMYELPEDVSQEVLDKYEIFYIYQYKSNKKIFKSGIGLNLTDGGGGSNGFKHTKAAKNKISKVHKGNKYRLGKCHTQETKDKISKSKIGKYVGELNPFFGKRHSKETKEKLLLSNRKRSYPIIQYTKEGIYIQEFPSINDALLKLNIKSSHGISDVCRGKAKYCKGFIFKYK